MSDLDKWYLINGLLIYIIAAVANFETYPKSTPIERVRGLLFVILFWPLAVYMAFEKSE